ncbi:unnamed protein product [Lactuca saligna]|uniref:Uncharacterized protein n=1 Tax=Lactuca saligna TaxID=75948 RepID=A0AA35VJ40_LACSI|nr:unnamed protein product [Lactuca saligna]
MVPNDEEKVVFHVYSCPKDATDDAEEFPLVARIPDIMLKRVNPRNTVLLTHLKTIDITIENGILLEREETKSKCTKKTDVGSSEKQVKESKSTKVPKKLPVTEVEPTIPEVIVIDTPITQKEIIPLKTGVFRRIKMKSKHKSRSLLTNVVRKPQITHQGLLFHEVPAHASPSSKRRRATDMAKHISKKKKKKSKMIISSESTADDDETIPETPEVNLHKETSTPAHTYIIPPEDSVAKSLSKEAQTSDIIVNVSNTDANVIMGEDDSKNETQGKPSTVTSETFVSFPPQITPIIPTTSTTNSPTFENIIKQPITSLSLHNPLIHLQPLHQFKSLFGFYPYLGQTSSMVKCE